MKKLHEIKNEYAGEQGRDSWDEFFEYCELTHTPLERMQYHHDEVSKRFAIEVAKETQINCAKNIKNPYEHICCFLTEEDARSFVMMSKNLPKL